jgi:S1-C subfamily serine protease
MGIVFAPIGEQTAQSLSLPPNQGVIVEEVRPLSAAADAGLHRGDIVLELDRHPVRSVEEVRRILARHRVGDRLVLTLLRGDGQREEVRLQLGRRPDTR